MPGPVIPTGMTWGFPQLLPRRSPKRPITPQRRGVSRGRAAPRFASQGAGRRATEGHLTAPLPTSLRFISALEIGVSRGTRDWCQTAAVPMPKSSRRSTVRFWPVPRRHRAGAAGAGMGERCFGHRQPRPSCRELPAPQRGADAGLFLILNEIKGWNCF